MKRALTRNEINSISLSFMIEGKKARASAESMTHAWRRKRRGGIISLKRKIYIPNSASKIEKGKINELVWEKMILMTVRMAR